MKSHEILLPRSSDVFDDLYHGYLPSYLPTYYLVRRHTSYIARSTIRTFHTMHA